MDADDQPVRVSFACNSHRNGNFLGRFEAVEIDMGGGDLVALSSRDGRAPRLRWLIGEGSNVIAVKVHRRRYRAHYRQRWEGNWCWDACQMTVPEARRLLAWLTDLGFEVDEWTDGGLAELRELP